MTNKKLEDLFTKYVQNPSDDFQQLSEQFIQEFGEEVQTYSKRENLLNDYNELVNEVDTLK